MGVILCREKKYECMHLSERERERQSVCVCISVRL